MIPIGLHAATLVLAWTAAASTAGPARSVAITIDDLPFVGHGLGLKEIQDETKRLLSAMKRHRVPAIGFVNEDKLEVPGEGDARVALLDAWLDAGMQLGNHGYGHVDFNSTPLERYQAAVLKGDHQDTMFAFFEAEADQLFGRSIPQILIIHANELNADAIEDVLARLRGRGYAFVSLDDALRDEAYRSRDGYVGPTGPSWLHRWRAGRGGDIQAALRREPDPPAWVIRLVDSPSP